MYMYIYIYTYIYIYSFIYIERDIWGARNLRDVERLARRADVLLAPGRAGLVGVPLDDLDRRDVLLRSRLHLRVRLVRLRTEKGTHNSGYMEQGIQRLYGKGSSELPWRKAGRPSHLVDVVDSGQ